jgi:predicted DCC family thiol-disulfide oxidoreductase YuxK
MAIVLFDGECNFCDASVQFILKRDPQANFKFTSLQSDKGMELLKKYNVPIEIDSLVLIDEEQYFTQSTAALKIAKKLTGPWKLFYIAIIVPMPFRDFIYRWIAKNRYKWFGKKQQCMLPTPDQRKRFL